MMQQRPDQRNQPNAGGRPGGSGRENFVETRNSVSINLNNYKQNIKNWVTDELKSDAVDFAKSLGEYVAMNGLTTSQIRIFFGEMKKIQMNGFNNERTNFLMLMPKLAYAVKRHDKEGLKKLYQFFEEVYFHVKDEKGEEGIKRFNNAMQLLEAVLAYHKYYGGKE